MDERVVRTRDVGPQAAGPLPQLLVDQYLVHRRPALAAELDRERAAVQARLDGRAADRGTPLARHLATGLLEFDLARLEDIAHEGAGTRLQLELGWRESQVHRVKDASRRHGGTDRVAGRGTRWCCVERSSATFSLRRLHPTAMHSAHERCTLAPDEETRGRPPPAPQRDPAPSASPSSAPRDGAHGHRSPRPRHRGVQVGRSTMSSVRHGAQWASSPQPTQSLRAPPANPAPPLPPTPDPVRHGPAAAHDHRAPRPSRSVWSSPSWSPSPRSVRRRPRPAATS